MRFEALECATIIHLANVPQISLPKAANHAADDIMQVEDDFSFDEV